MRYFIEEYGKFVLMGIGVMVVLIMAFFIAQNRKEINSLNQQLSEVTTSSQGFVTKKEVNAMIQKEAKETETGWDEKQAVSSEELTKKLQQEAEQEHKKLANQVESDVYEKVMKQLEEEKEAEKEAENAKKATTKKSTTKKSVQTTSSVTPVQQPVSQQTNNSSTSAEQDSQIVADDEDATFIVEYSIIE